MVYYMKDNSSKVKITTNDLHLKNIFLNDFYLELGNIEIDVLNRILKYEIVPIKEISYFPIQNKGLGRFVCDDNKLRDELPYMYFKMVNNNDRSKQLYLTYGLLECYKPNFKDRFMPVFLLPIDLYYEDNEFFVHLNSKPFENPLIYTIFNEQNKLNFIQSKNLNNLYVLDQSLLALNKISNFNIKLESYLTFATKKRKNILENDKIFKQVKLFDNYCHTKVYGKDDYYMSIPYSKQQRVFLNKALNKENLTLSGRDGTGKTTVLKDIAINLISKGERVIYISNKKSTINNVNKSFEEVGLKNIVADFTSRFDQLNKYDNKFNQLDLIDYEKDLQQLLENYDKIENYEQLMGGRILDFLFKEVLEQLSVLIDIDHTNTNILNEDDLNKLEYVHKNEFIEIKSALEKIQSNLYKLESFKNSVWKEIPIFTTLKYATSILSLIKNLHGGYSKLYESRNKIENEYGINVIENFASFKKIVNIIKKVESNLIPNKWQKSYEIYTDAQELYNELKKDLYMFQENEYILQTNYIDPFSIDIKKEINLVLDNRFTLEDKDLLDNIFMDCAELKSVVEQTLFDINEYNKSKANITKDLGWDFTKRDDDILELIRFNDLVNSKTVTIRVSNALISDKLDDVINNIKKIKQKSKKVSDEIKEIVSLYPEIVLENIKEAKKVIKEEPNKAKSLRRKYGKITLSEIDALFDKYLELNKQTKKIEDEYYVTTGFKLDDVNNDGSVFEEIRDYYNSIKEKDFACCIKHFFDNYDSRQKNGKKEILLKNLSAFKKSYYSLNELFNVFSNYSLLNKDLDFVSKMGEINSVIDYLNIVFRSNHRVMSKIKNNEMYFVKLNDYLELDSIIDKYNKSLSILKNNEKYEYAFSVLYDEEKTNINVVSKVMQIYNDYSSIFASSEKLIESFKNIKKLKNIAVSSEEELNNINETLKIYTKIFKDGVARYYYNDFQSILGYLNILSKSKDELIAYLNITSGMATLNHYKLNGLIDYIIKNDKNDNIVNDFEYVYFNKLKEKYLKNKNLNIDDGEFIDLLKETINLESKICSACNNNIIKSIFEMEIKKSHNKEVQKRNYQKFIRKNSIKSLVLADSSTIEHGLSLKSFDTIIIDDAEILNSADFLSALKNKQIIIAGSYLIHKAFTNSLLSIYFDEKTTIFKERFIPTPKKLLDKIGKMNGVIQNNVYKNNGVEVLTANIDEFIYSLYNENNNVRINYFIKDNEKQKRFIEQLATTFLKNGIDAGSIMNFLNENIYIEDLLMGQLSHCDYNIIDLSEYLYIDSEVESVNAFDHLLLTKEKLIIYDKNNDLLNEDLDEKLLLYQKIKGITLQKSEEELYNFEILDENMAMIIYALKEKGYTVYPYQGMCDFIVLKEDRFVAVNVLFSNSSYSEVLNDYRSLSSEFTKYGWEIVFINLMSCSKGISYVVNTIISKIEKKVKKKGKK